MTTDITELAQMKGQKVEGSYYLAECTDCGKMYPSNKLNGGEPLFSGDYGECYCPHCNADDAAIGDCGDTAAIAWNYQQDRIDALVEALEKAQTERDEYAACERTVAVKNVELQDEIYGLKARIAELENNEVRQRLANAEHQLHMAWLRFHSIKASRNTQFKKRKAAERRIAELEGAEQKLCAANVTLDARAELAERQLAELESRTVTVKLPQRKTVDPYCYDQGGNCKALGYNEALADCRINLADAGIKWEAE